MADYRLSKIIKSEIEVLNKSIRRLTSLNSTYDNRIKKNEVSVEDLNGKIKSLERLIKDTKDSNELKRLENLIKSYRETVESFPDLNKDLENKINSNNNELETQSGQLENLTDELSETLIYESRLKERSQITYVDLDNSLNTNLLLPSTINITSGTEVEILTDYNSNTYIKIGKHNSPISGSISKSLDYSKIIIDNFSSNGGGEVVFQRGKVDGNNFSSYTIQSFNYDISISLGGYKFLLFDYENLFTDNTIWVQLTGSGGKVVAAK